MTVWSRSFTPSFNAKKAKEAEQKLAQLANIFTQLDGNNFTPESDAHTIHQLRESLDELSALLRTPSTHP